MPPQSSKHSANNVSNDIIYIADCVGHHPWTDYFEKNGPDRNVESDFTGRRRVVVIAQVEFGCIQRSGGKAHGINSRSLK